MTIKSRDICLNSKVICTLSEKKQHSGKVRKGSGMDRPGKQKRTGFGKRWAS